MRSIAGHICIRIVRFFFASLCLFSAMHVPLYPDRLKVAFKGRRYSSADHPARNSPVSTFSDFSPIGGRDVDKRNSMRSRVPFRQIIPAPPDRSPVRRLNSKSSIQRSRDNNVSGSVLRWSEYQRVATREATRRGGANINLRVPVSFAYSQEALIHRLLWMHVCIRRNPYRGL